MNKLPELWRDGAVVGLCVWLWKIYSAVQSFSIIHMRAAEVLLLYSFFSYPTTTDVVVASIKQLPLSTHYR